MTIQMGGSRGLRLPAMSGADLKRTIVPHTITLASDLGAAVDAARRTHADPSTRALAVTGGQRLFGGKIVDVERRMAGGSRAGAVRIGRSRGR